MIKGPNVRWVVLKTGALEVEEMKIILLVVGSFKCLNHVQEAPFASEVATYTRIIHRGKDYQVDSHCNGSNA